MTVKKIRFAAFPVLRLIYIVMGMSFFSYFVSLVPESIEQIMFAKDVTCSEMREVGIGVEEMSELANTALDELKLHFEGNAYLLVILSAAFLSCIWFDHHSSAFRRRYFRVMVTMVHLSLSCLSCIFIFQSISSWNHFLLVLNGVEMSKISDLENIYMHLEHSFHTRQYAYMYIYINLALVALSLVYVLSLRKKSRGEGVP